MQSMDPIGVVRFILGMLLILFTPGFIWTFVFFDKKEIDPLERVVLSFVISMAIIPLLVFFLYKLTGMKITEFNTLLLTSIFCIMGIICVYIKRKLRR